MWGEAGAERARHGKEEEDHTRCPGLLVGELTSAVTAIQHAGDCVRSRGFCLCLWAGGHRDAAQFAGWYLLELVPAPVQAEICNKKWCERLV